MKQGALKKDMSGFGGILTNHGRPPSAAHLNAMARTLRHRGGDGDGQYATGGLGVVHSRLASKEYGADEQPMFDDDGAVLVADAEFAYRNIAAQGANPIELYREKGVAFAGDVHGSFALALYDPGEHWLILARDLFGTRPLYYAETSEGLLFGSQIACLKATGLIDISIDPDAADELVQLQFNCGRRTLYKGILRVLPGEMLVAQRGKVVERIRREALPPGGRNRLSKEHALEELSSALTKSFDQCLEPTVPMGITYAGDIETTVLLDAIMELGRKPPIVFTPSLAGPAGDGDRERSRYYADLMDIEINEIEISEDDFWTLLPSIVSALDDPSADYSALYSYKVAEQAASQVKIMLSSIGADEIFAGRSRYRSTLRPAWFGGKAMYARGFMEGLGLLRQEKSSWRDGINAAQNRNESVVITKLQQAQALDAGDFLSNDLLNVSDRAFAAHSIELRYPYLEPDVVRLGYRLDDQLKIAHGLGKSLLRHRLRQKYADPIVSRRSRRASIPARDWIAGRAQDLGDLIANSPGVAEIFHQGEVRHLFRTMQGPAGKRPGLAAWQLLFYALWHKIHLEGATPEGDVFEVLRS